MPKAEHAELITSMERIEEHRRALAKQDDAATPGAGGEGERPTRRERVYLEAHQSIDAASPSCTCWARSAPSTTPRATR
ncbi:MAG: hypothetical protein R3F05_19785 [Planctomycetota bacterium]